MKERLLLLFAELDEYGISYRRLSREMGKHQSYIGNVMSSNRTLSQDAIEYLTARFNVNPEWLQTGVGSMFLDGGKTNNVDQAIFITKWLSLPKRERQSVENIVDILYEHVDQDHQER